MINSPEKNELASTLVDHRDRLLISNTPIVLVPKFGPVPDPISGSGHRFLVAHDGVWLELVRPWIHLLTRVTDTCPIRIPLGTLQESIAITHQLPRSLVHTFVKLAQVNCCSEQAAFITIDSESHFALRQVDIIDNDGARIEYRCPRLNPGEDIVIDMHSHALHDAHFSIQDDIDDHEMVKFSLVVGNCNKAVPSIAIRLCALGKFIPMHLPPEFFQ